jgi:hypothetical protein
MDDEGDAVTVPIRFLRLSQCTVNRLNPAAFFCEGRLAEASVWRTGGGSTSSTAVCVEGVVAVGFSAMPGANELPVFALLDPCNGAPDSPFHGWARYHMKCNAEQGSSDLGSRRGVQRTAAIKRSSS